MYFNFKTAGINIINTDTNEMYCLRALSLDESGKQSWQLSTFFLNEYDNLDNTQIEYIDINPFAPKYRQNQSVYSILANIRTFDTTMPEQIYTDAESLLQAKTELDNYRTKKKKNPENLAELETIYKTANAKFNQTLEQLPNKKIFSTPEKCLENKKNVANLLNSLQKTDTETLKNILRDYSEGIPSLLQFYMLDIIKTNTQGKDNDKFILEIIDKIFSKKYNALREEFMFKQPQGKIESYITHVGNCLTELQENLNLNDIKKLFKIVDTPKNQSTLEEKQNVFTEFYNDNFGDAPTNNLKKSTKVKML